MNKEIFYQDFLMDFEYDDNDYPIVELIYNNNSNCIEDVSVDYNLFDSEREYIRKVSLSNLLNIYSKKDWDYLFDKAKKTRYFVYC